MRFWFQTGFEMNYNYLALNINLYFFHFSFDGLESLAILSHLATPRISDPDQVLIRVLAASVDPVDISLMSGLGRHERLKAVDHEDVLVLGRDLSGKVVEVGTNVNSLKVGDNVWALVPILERHGALADFVVLNEDLVRRKPNRVSHEGAATVPYSGVEAWRALHHAGILPNVTTKGKTVLVVDATSSVGCLAVQLVRAWGGNVVSVVNQRKFGPLAQMLGSSKVIVIENDDEAQEILEDELADLKLEAVIITSNYGPGDLPSKFYQLYLKIPSQGFVKAIAPERLDSDSYGLLRRGAMKLPLLGRLWRSNESILSRKRAHERRVILDELKRLIDSSMIQPVLDSTSTVTECEEAFQRTATKATIGKAIVTFS